MDKLTLLQAVYGYSSFRPGQEALIDGVLAGKEATGYPGTEEGLRKGGAVTRDVPVMALDNVITGNGPASSLRFALAIVANSMGEHVAQAVGSGMLF